MIFIRKLFLGSQFSGEQGVHSSRLQNKCVKHENNEPLQFLNHWLHFKGHIFS